MRSICLTLFALAMMQSIETLEGAESGLARTRQCLVVVGDDWNSTTGILRAFERTGPAAPWKKRGHNVPVMLGKKGFAWGRGLAGTDVEPGPRKVEGDNKVPAGIFQLGPAFGYAPPRDARWIRLRYVPATERTEAIDDPRSRYYNQLVDRTKIAQPDWQTSEQMRRADHLYKWGIFVAHNPAAVPGAGSCIFIHIWKDPSTATVGCTAMAEPDLLGLLRWLDPKARPVLIQMPSANYAALQARFGLPNLH